MDQLSRGERRHRPRVTLSCLVRIAPTIAVRERFEEILHTENSSREGLLASAAGGCYKKHMRLFVKFPYSMAGGSLNREYLAEVVRVEPRPGGREVVAMQLIASVNLGIEPQVAANARPWPEALWRAD